MGISRNTWAAGVVGATLSCAPSHLDTAAPSWGLGPGAVAGVPLVGPFGEPPAYTVPRTSPDAPQALAEELQEAVLLPSMEEWPITWTPERMRLAAAYFQAHKGWEVGPDADVDALTTMDPKMVVVHWTAGASARSAFHTFRQERQTGQRIRRDWNAVNLAAHFVVDRDGTIIRLMPETRMGRHTIGLNHLAIGIENVGDGDRLPLTAAQVDANARLVRWLSWRYDLTHLIGHYEYQHFEGHPYFQENFDWFRTGRVDPGTTFMAQLRTRLADLDLAGAPRSDG